MSQVYPNGVENRTASSVERESGRGYSAGLAETKPDTSGKPTGLAWATFAGARTKPAAAAVTMVRCLIRFTTVISVCSCVLLRRADVHGVQDGAVRTGWVSEPLTGQECQRRTVPVGDHRDDFWAVRRQELVGGAGQEWIVRQRILIAIKPRAPSLSSQEVAQTSWRS